MEKKNNNWDAAETASYAVIGVLVGAVSGGTIGAIVGGSLGVLISEAAKNKGDSNE